MVDDGDEVDQREEHGAGGQGRGVDVQRRVDHGEDGLRAEVGQDGGDGGQGGERGQGLNHAEKVDIGEKGLGDKGLPAFGALGW